ncbi:MAG: pyridoxamine 5'-phosphate oxidase [Bacteroidota bacterium]
MSTSLKNIRTDYVAFELDEAHVDRHPFRQFERWMRHAIDARVEEPNAMTVATTGSDGHPDARVVLLRDLDKKGFVFFTNFRSRKGRELRANRRVCINFFWPELQRQVRIRGKVEKVSSRASDLYFQSRPRQSQIGAWASLQSESMVQRSELEERFVMFERKFAGKKVPRPSFWGGYRVVPDHIEFWQGRPSRLHDRIAYDRQRNGRWKLSRLYP